MEKIDEQKADHEEISSMFKEKGNVSESEVGPRKTKKKITEHCSKNLLGRRPS